MPETTSLARFLAEMPDDQRITFKNHKASEQRKILGCYIYDLKGNLTGSALSFTGTEQGTSPDWNDKLAIGLIDAAQHDGVWEGERKANKEAARRAKARATRKRNTTAAREAEKNRVTKLQLERLNPLTKEES